LCVGVFIHCPKTSFLLHRSLHRSLAISYDYWLISGTALIAMMRGILVKVLLFASTGNSFTNVLIILQSLD
jgi:hypothetical protein